MIIKPRLTNEDLDKIKMPLSEVDYQLLDSHVWSLTHRMELTKAFLEEFEWKALRDPSSAAYSDLA